MDFDPDAYLAASPPGGGFDPDAYLKGSEAHPSVPMGGLDAATAGDVAKSAGIGVVKGGIGLAGLPGDIASGFNRGVDWVESKLGVTPQPRSDALTSGQLTRGVESLTGPLYEPKTKAGQYAQTVGEFVPGMVGGPEGLAYKAATRVLAPAVASETAGQATEGTALEPYARVAGALVGHELPFRTVKAFHPGPNEATEAMLEHAVDSGYGQARGYGIEMRRKPVADLSDRIKQHLDALGNDEIMAPKAFALVEKLKNPPGKYVTISDIDNVRKKLGRITGSGEEMHAARNARYSIDHFLDTLDPRDVAVNAHFTKDAVEALREARANSAGLKGHEGVMEQMEKAQNRAGSTYSGTNLDNATRQNIRKFLDNPKLKKFLNDDEIKQAERIVRGTPFGNASRFVGKNLRWLIGMAVGHDLGGIGGMLATHAAGHALTHVGAELTKREARQLAAMARAKTPLGKSLPQPAQAPVVSNVERANVGLLGRSPGENDPGTPFAKGGAVTPPLSTRKESHYASARGKPGHKCGVCAHYRKPNKCELVGGFIAAGGGCDWFSAKRSVGGSLEAEERPLTEISMDPSEREDNAAAAETARNVAASRSKQSVKPDMGRGWTGTVDEYLNRKTGAD